MTSSHLLMVAMGLKSSSYLLMVAMGLNVIKSSSHGSYGPKCHQVIFSW